MANVFKRVLKDGSYSWFIRFRDETGKDVREAVKAKTKREAEYCLAEKISRLADGSLSRSRRQQETKFFEIADDFMSYSVEHKRSAYKDRISIQRWKAFLGDVLCASITKSKIEQYILCRSRGEGGLGDKAKPATINRELACLRTIFKRAVNEEKIVSNPMSGFKLLFEDNIRQKVLTDEEFSRLIEKAPKHIVPILITAWETGMRKGEIINLKWAQVDLQKGLITLRREETKTGRGRVVPISQRLKSVLQVLPRKCSQVFLYRDRPIRNFNTAFAVAVKSSSLKGLWFHDLRHCFVTRMRRSGVPDRVVMEITGHRTFECFRRYDIISTDDLLAAVC
jgi:integrase